MKSQKINVLGLATHCMSSVSATPLCCCSGEAAVDSTSANGGSCVLIKPYSQNQHRTIFGWVIVCEPLVQTKVTGETSFKVYF